MPQDRPSGNIFVPQPDPGAVDQQPATGQLGAIMPGAAQQPMQPAQTPEEHAQNKQGWLDWLRDPSTSAFLMQFGASMLQPNPRGFGAQLGQSVGEAGQAVGRVGEIARQQAASEADVAEKQAQAGYYKAETAAMPELTQARTDVMSAKANELQSLLYYKQIADQARSEGDLAKAQLADQQAQQLQLQMKYPNLKYYWQAVDKWQGDYDQAIAAGLTPPPRPDPTQPPWNLPPEALGLPTGTKTSTVPAPGGKPDLSKTAPIPADTPDFVATVRGMTAEERANYTQIYYGRGGKQWTTWQTVLDRLKESGAGKPPITGRETAPGVTPPPGVAPGKVDPNAPLNQKILQTIQSGGGL